jgi:hypothetical protein
MDADLVPLEPLLHRLELQHEAAAHLAETVEIRREFRDRRSAQPLLTRRA